MDIMPFVSAFGGNPYVPQSEDCEYLISDTYVSALRPDIAYVRPQHQRRPSCQR